MVLHQLKCIPFVLKTSQFGLEYKIATTFRMYHNKGFVNGGWVDAVSKKTFPVYNPATGEEICNVPDMTTEDVKLAIDAAHRAFGMWKNTTSRERANFLRKMHDLIMQKKNEMAKVMTLENGKPLNESLGEIAYGADYIEWFAEETRRIHGEVLQSPFKNKEMTLIRQPIGVAGMLTPWNFPMAMIARKVGAALAAGCTCVIKPAEDTPLSALMLADVAIEAGLPAGVINIVTASRENTPAIGMEMCASPLVAGISFTGSTAVGKLLYKQCSSTVKRLSLELGGNAPFIVFETANVDLAVAGVMASKFRNCGQTCVSTNRILVHSKVFDTFVEKLKKAMGSLVVGDGMKEGTTQGPLVNAAQFNKVSDIVQDAVKKGAKVHLGGKPHALGQTFYEPTLLTGITPSMTCYNEEIFGPIAIVMKFDKEEDALSVANNTRSGLASYFYSNDLSQIRRVSRELEYGMVGINEGMISCAEAAFGGIKESGFGREGSHHGIDDYVNIKYLCQGNL